MEDTAQRTRSELQAAAKSRLGSSGAGPGSAALAAPRGRGGGRAAAEGAKGQRDAPSVHSPLATGASWLRPFSAPLPNRLWTSFRASICSRQVTLQILSLGERQSCRHGSGEGGATARRWGQKFFYGKRMGVEPETEALGVALMELLGLIGVMTLKKCLYRLGVGKGRCMNAS